VPRPAVLLALAVGAAVLLAGCGSGTVVSPTAQTVIGPLQKPSAPGKGNPTAGKAVFAAQGCGGCHTFTPAGTHGTVGPDLDKLPQAAQTAGQPLDQFISTSITDPGAYVAPGYPNGVMPTSYSSLSQQQIADLVAFLSQK